MTLLVWQERTLIRQLNKGDPDALRRVYECYRGDLTTLATGLLFDKGLAEDAVHDLFARLADPRRPLQITRNLRAYLMRAVANTARNLNRANRRTDEGQDTDAIDSFSTAPSPEYSAVFRERRERLLSILPQLPYEQREVLLLRHYGDLRFAAIAECQGVSTSTVQGRYRYGLEKLRSLMGGEL